MDNGRDMRELIVVILLGFFIGLTVGYYIGHHDSGDLVSTYYKEEIKRLQTWNDSLIKTFLSTQEKRR